MPSSSTSCPHDSPGTPGARRPGGRCGKGRRPPLRPEAFTVRMRSDETFEFGAQALVMPPSEIGFDPTFQRLHSKLLKIALPRRGGKAQPPVPQTRHRARAQLRRRAAPSLRDVTAIEQSVATLVEQLLEPGPRQRSAAARPGGNPGGTSRRWTSRRAGGRSGCRSERSITDVPRPVMAHRAIGHRWTARPESPSRGGRPGRRSRALLGSSEHGLLPFATTLTGPSTLSAPKCPPWACGPSVTPAFTAGRFRTLSSHLSRRDVVAGPRSSYSSA